MILAYLKRSILMQIVRLTMPKILIIVVDDLARSPPNQRQQVPVDIDWKKITCRPSGFEKID